MASLPVIHEPFSLPRNSTRSPTTSCSRWPAPDQRSCNRARLNSQKNSESHSGVAARLFECLGKAGINIQLVSTSEIKIAVIIDEKDLERAAHLTHQEL